MFQLYALVIVVLLWLAYSCLRPKNFPPGPTLLPVLGNLPYYLRQHKLCGYHHMIWMNLRKKYGSVVGMKLGKYYVVCVQGPKAIKEVLYRDEFNGRPDGFFFRLRTFGERLGVVFTDGERWQKYRKFSAQTLKTFGSGRPEFEEKIQKECAAMVNHFAKNCDQPVFMHHSFEIFIVNITWSILTGQRFDINDAKLKTILSSLRECFRLMDGTGGILNQVPFIRLIAPTASGYNRFMEILTSLWPLLQEAIDEHKKSVIYEPRDFIDTYLQTRSLQVDGKLTNNQLLCICLDLFMAGAETVTHSLAFGTMYMVLHPDIQKKVQKELDEVVGRNRWPTWKDRTQLKYTQAVLLEILRKSSVAALGIAHRATKDTKLMGYDIPEDTLVVTNLYSVHMDPEVWPEPDKFKPERFLDQNGNIVVNEDHFMPFGLGKRRCLGEELAKHSVFLFFTVLVHNFNLEAIEGCYPNCVPSDGITLSAKPFKVKLSVRDTA